MGGSDSEDSQSESMHSEEEEEDEEGESSDMEEEEDEDEDDEMEGSEAEAEGSEPSPSPKKRKVRHPRTLVSTPAFKAFRKRCGGTHIYDGEATKFLDGIVHSVSEEFLTKIIVSASRDRVTVITPEFISGLHDKLIHQPTYRLAPMTS